MFTIKSLKCIDSSSKNKQTIPNTFLELSGENHKRNESRREIYQMLVWLNVLSLHLCFIVQTINAGAIYINISKQFKETKLLATFTVTTWQTHVKVSFTDAQTYDLKK